MSQPPHLPPSYLLPTRKQGRQEWIFALGTAMGILWVLNLSVSSASPRDINHNPPFRAMVVAAKKIRNVRTQFWGPTEKVYIARWASFQKRLQTCFEAPGASKPQASDQVVEQIAEVGLKSSDCLKSGLPEVVSVEPRHSHTRKHRRGHRRYYRWR